MDEAKIILNGENLSASNLNQKFKKETTNSYLSIVYKFIMDWFDSNDYILQKTSGSTGQPKEIRLTKNAMAASAKATLKFFQLKHGETAWLCLPIDYIAGKMMVVRAIIGKLNLIITEPSGTPEIPNEKIDFTAMVPLQIKNLIDRNANFSNIQKIIIGGAAIDNSLLKSIESLHTVVYATYGMTETCSHVALQQINGKRPDDHFHTLSGISVGKSESGCLIIEAPTLADKPIQTTDIVEVISPTEFRWLGRADHVINSGGIKISPEEIEALIRPLIPANFIISSKEDEILGSKIVLVIEGYSMVINEFELLKEIAQLTGKHKAPKEVIFLNEFPLNPSMKIDRKKIRAFINKKQSE